ncbi:MAG: hypothetical protein JSR18_05105 [Proteobacteria bacterium]|nr:hypothetical protein [Pseudomonadota bacterium]
MRAPEPQRFDLECSRLQRAFVVLSHAATAVVIACVPLPPGCAPCAWLLLVALAWREWQRLPPAALVVRLDATLTLLWRNGTAVDAFLANGGYLCRWLAIIEWHESGRRRRQTLAITPDMLDAEAFRRLRVQLRYASSEDAHDSPLSHACASTSAPLSALGCAPIR